jgi:hypothetical protein
MAFKQHNRIACPTRPVCEMLCDIRGGQHMPSIDAAV